VVELGSALGDEEDGELPHAVTAIIATGIANAAASARRCPVKPGMLNLNSSL
jgi:hypothetical protein